MIRNTDPIQSEARFERWKAACKATGLKLTHQRLEILRELAQDESHPDAEALFQAVRTRVPTVSLDTVYRTLWLLHDLGLVGTLGPRRDSIRFDVNLEPHHHFVCVRCGLVRDFVSDELDQLRVPDAVQGLGGVLEARVEVRGVCKACEAGTEPSTPPTGVQDHE